MPINTTQLRSSLEAIANSATGADSELLIEQISLAISAIENNLSVYTVPTSGMLPLATDNVGNFVYSIKEKLIYFSNGITWTQLQAVNIVNDVTADETNTAASSLAAQQVQDLINQVTTAYQNYVGLRLIEWGDNAYGQLGLGNTTNQPTPLKIGEHAVTDACASYDTISTIRADGSMWTCGYNYDGRLGVGDSDYRSSPVQVGTLTDWAKLIKGHYAGAAIKTDGTLWMWGKNDRGQLGQGDIIPRSSPTQVGALTDWQDAGNGYRQTLAIKDDGTLWGWGDNYAGQLAGSLRYLESASQIIPGNDWAYLSEGFDNFVAIKTDGTMWTWGDNYYGQLGHGDTISRSLPVQVGTDSNWTSAVMNDNVLTAIKSDGTLWTCGNGNVGQLAQGYSTSLVSSPTQVGSLTNWSQVSSGGIRTIALKNDGTLWGWGDNYGDQLGLPHAAILTSPIQNIPGSWSKINTSGRPDQSVALGIMTDGTLWSWGKSGLGVLGDGTTDEHSLPPRQIGILTNWLDVKSNSTHAMALKTDGTLWSWGYNESGKLGLGDTVNRSSPVQVGTLTDWAQISCGYNSQAAIKADGTLWVWGNDYNGVLGLGDYIPRSSPTQVGSLTNWAQIAVGSNSLAIKTDGTLWCWGLNIAGSLGLGNSNSYSSYNSPVQIGSSTDWAKIVNGGYVSLAIKTNGTLWAWGTLYNGALGLGTSSLSYSSGVSSPTQVGTRTDWVDIDRFSLGTTADGALWGWGSNTFGQLGLGDLSNRSSPVQIGSLSTWNVIDTQYAIKADNSLWSLTNWTNNKGQNIYFSPAQIGTDSNWQSINVTPVSLATAHFAEKTNGEWWCWGSSSYGLLGLGNQLPQNQSSPMLFANSGVWSEIVGSNGSMYGIKPDGSLWSWGAGWSGKLGLGDQFERSSPTQVGSLTDWASIGTSGAYKFAVIKTDGTAWTCGYSDGSLGAGFVTTLSSPVQIGSDTNWSVLSAWHGLKTDGTLWSFGRPDAPTELSSPVQVGSLSTWKKADISSSWFTALIKTDGTLWTCGYNNYGQLGQGDSLERKFLVQIGADNNWDTLACGYGFNVAVKTTGTLWAWGDNSRGQLGLGDIINRSSPTQIGALTDWKEVACGYNGMTYAIKTNGTLWGWGLNTEYQLGLGDIINRSSPVQIGSSNAWKKITGGQDTAAGIMLIE